MTLILAAAAPGQSPQGAPGASSNLGPPYDLLFKGGHVIDPANLLDDRRDVAVKDGKIAAVGENIPATDARLVVNVSGLYVTPGLIDIHVHVGHGGARLDWFEPDSPSGIRPLGIIPDTVLTSGVTTIVDAGSSGADTFLREKYEAMDHSTVRVLAFLNIVAAGMNSGREQDVTEMDPVACADTINRFRDVIVGCRPSALTKS